MKIKIRFSNGQKITLRGVSRILAKNDEEGWKYMKDNGTLMLNLRFVDEFESIKDSGKFEKLKKD